MMSISAREEDHSASARRSMWLYSLAALGLIVGSVALAFGISQLHLGWPGRVGSIAIMIVATLVLMRGAERRTRALGCGSPAMARYGRRMMISSMVYMVTFLGATYAYKAFHISGPALWAAAFASSLGIIGMIWAMARLIAEETDEYLRFRTIKAALFAIAAALVVTTVWGFLEQFGLVPHVPSWAVMPVFAIMLGLGNFVPWVRS